MGILFKYTVFIPSKTSVTEYPSIFSKLFRNLSALISPRRSRRKSPEILSKKKNFITEALVYPGALIQKITTAEPDDYMIKVAIAAIREIV